MIQTTTGGARRLLERWPATVLFMAASSLLTGVVEQPLPDSLPLCLGAVQADGIGLLNFDGAATPLAGDPQQVSLYLGQPLRSDRAARRFAFR